MWVRTSMNEGRGKACQTVLGEDQVGTSREGDKIIRVKGDEFAQPQVPGERSGLRGNSLHQIAVADQDVRVVIHDDMPRPVEACRECRLGDGHADGIPEALTEGAGGGFHAGRLAVFGVARRFAAPLAEAFDFFQRQVKARHV
jgi:hypothetical protein